MIEGGIEDRMIFIDYDNAAFGFRAFDLAYHFFFDCLI